MGNFTTNLNTIIYELNYKKFGYKQRCTDSYRDAELHLNYEKQ